MDVREMKVGRKLDAEIAKKVFNYYLEWEKYSINPTGEPPYINPDFGGLYQQDCPNYSTEISAAWEVFNKMDMPTYLNKSYLKTFGVGEIGWRVNWCKDQGCDPSNICEHGNDIWELTAPLAIAKAALLQMGVS